MTSVRRLLRHLFAAPARRHYPEDVLHRIADAIAASERRHSGEVCFAVEAALPWPAVLRGVDARTRALATFARLRTWDTAANNGVLLYLLLADHRIEIVADRGLDGVVGPEAWREVCARIEDGLRAGRHEAAVLDGIAAISAHLEAHFPQAAGSTDEDELPNRPYIL